MAIWAQRIGEPEDDGDGGVAVGDVVIAPIPFTDLSDSKERPALVAADVGMGDWLLVTITSRTLNRPGDVEITQSDMQTGELMPGYIRTNRLHTINESEFIDVVGRVTAPKLLQVRAAIRRLF